VSELLYKEEIFQLVGLCMEIHRELGRGHDEVIYKDAFVVEVSRARIPFSREKITKSPIRELSCLTIITRTSLSGINSL
jgi:GxxExxY protein